MQEPVFSLPVPCAGLAWSYTFFMSGVPCLLPETLAPWLRPALTWSSHFCLGHTPGGLAGCVGAHLLPLHRFAKPFLSSSVVRALRVSADSCLVPLSSVSRRPEGLALGPRLPLCLVLWVPGDRAHS